MGFLPPLPSYVRSFQSLSRKTPRTISSTARTNSSSLTEKNDMHISAPKNANAASAAPARQPLRLFGLLLLIPYTSALRAPARAAPLLLHSIPITKFGYRKPKIKNGCTSEKYSRFLFFAQMKECRVFPMYLDPKRLLLSLLSEAFAAVNGSVPRLSLIHN